MIIDSSTPVRFIGTPGVRVQNNIIGAAAFNPIDLNPVAWYDFSDASTLFTDAARSTPVSSDGDVIGGVTDKSTSGNHLSQTTTAAKPIYKTGIKNGHSAGLWNGLNTTIKAAFSLSQPVQFFIVTRYTATLDFLLDGPTINNAMSLWTTTTSGDLRMYSVAAGQIFSGYPLSTWMVISGLYSGASSKLRKDADAASDATVGTATTPGGVVLGSASAGTSPINGHIVDSIFYDYALSSSQWTDVLTYLNTRYAIY